MPLVRFKYSNGGFNDGEVASFDLATCKRLVKEKVAVFYTPEKESSKNTTVNSATANSTDTKKTDDKKENSSKETSSRKNRQAADTEGGTNYKTK